MLYSEGDSFQVSMILCWGALFPRVRLYPLAAFKKGDEGGEGGERGERSGVCTVASKVLTLCRRKEKGLFFWLLFFRLDTSLAPFDTETCNNLQTSYDYDPTSQPPTTTRKRLW